MTFHPPCPTFSKEIKAEVIKVDKRKSSVCITLSPQHLKVISDCGVLFSTHTLFLSSNLKTLLMRTLQILYHKEF